jgi:hypothetical protein
VTPTKRKLLVIKARIKERSFLSQEKIVQILSLHHDLVKRLITEELNMRRVDLKQVPDALTASPKLERVKISGKLFGQLNTLQVNDPARVITVMKPVSTLKIRDPQLR